MAWYDILTLVAREKGMKKYVFYGWDTPDVKPKNTKYAKVKNQRHLYDLLSGIWCVYSCAPRYRSEWTKENKTLGQCSITSFLVQDIFGGRVYGVPLDEGGYHCYNEVDGQVFDLTSEQFGDKKLAYTLENEQFREEHFKSEEKKARYEYIAVELKKLM